MNLKLLSFSAVSALGIAMTSTAASAATVSHSFDGVNDCSGYFTTGSGFSSCQIFISEQDKRILISPVVAKYTGDLIFDEANSAFPSFTGPEMSFDNLVDSGDDDNISGDWTYTRGDEDPGIRYWAAKSGGGPSGGFELFWTVADAITETGSACDGTNNFNLACLSAALVVTEGSWFTPGEKELSHLTFYDSLDPQVVPLPAAGWFLLAGLGGIAAMKRRKK